MIKTITPATMGIITTAIFDFDFDSINKIQIYKHK